MIFPANLKVFLAPGITDLRKSINGLSILVEEYMDLDLFSGYLFGFCNRRRNSIKILYWDHNGFCLWMKRLEKDKFSWPEKVKDAESIPLTQREFSWLLDGLELKQKSHQSLKYSSVL